MPKTIVLPFSIFFEARTRNSAKHAGTSAEEDGAIGLAAIT
jgi:hypothetical protein